MTKNKYCPYTSLPDSSYWRRFTAGQIDEMDPVTSVKFKINKNDRIMTAGSCFAQNIARYLARSGYNYEVVEKGSEILNESILKEYNYSVFSARYGNIYTTRQLIQLVRRAYGEFQPIEDCWEEDGEYYDPYRPYIQPGGFASKAEFKLDRKAHFAAIRHIVENFDVFIFTLGLTEMWEDKRDGTVFAACPGCGPGVFDSENYRFVNLTAQEVTDDLQEFVSFCQQKNPKGRIILTVSPVPLIATYTNASVLVATIYSKSVLRVAAQEIIDRHSHVDYFPSYEIFTSHLTGGAYYQADKREVTEMGVHHAMQVFYKHYLRESMEKYSPNTQPDKPPKEELEISVNNSISQVVCDEDRILMTSKPGFPK